MKLQVALNGTDTNPYEKYGLTQNPYPQIAKAEYTASVLKVQKLGGPPIPHDNYEAYIREVLEGFNPDFIDLCVLKFEPGKMVKFNVFWLTEEEVKEGKQ